MCLLSVKVIKRSLQHKAHTVILGAVFGSYEILKNCSSAKNDIKYILTSSSIWGISSLTWFLMDVQNCGWVVDLSYWDISLLGYDVKMIMKNYSREKIGSFIKN